MLHIPRRKSRKLQKLAYQEWSLHCILKTITIMNLWKVGSDKCYSNHFLIHHSLWPSLEFRLFSKSQNHGMISSHVHKGWVLIVKQYKTMKPPRMYSHAQFQELNGHELRSFSTYKTEKKEKRSATNGSIFGEISLSRLKGGKWATMDPSYNWYPLVVLQFFCITSIPVRLRIRVAPSFVL